MVMYTGNPMIAQSTARPAHRIVLPAQGLLPLSTAFMPAPG